MSELIDKAVLMDKMYSEAFESDTDMQRWDSGCWIRYKLFEKVVDSTPTVPYGPRWHRVEERPDEHTNLLLHDERGNYHAGCISTYLGYTEYIDMGGNTLHDIDYWMPIEPPKEDA